MFLPGSGRSLPGNSRRSDRGMIAPTRPAAMLGGTGVTVIAGQSATDAGSGQSCEPRKW